MPTLVPVEGTLRRQMLDTAPPAHGRARNAWAQYERALTTLPWGRAHRRWVALVDDGPLGERALPVGLPVALPVALPVGVPAGVSVGLRRAGVLASAHRYAPASARSCRR